MLLEHTRMPPADMNLQAKGKCSFGCLVGSRTSIGPTSFSRHTNNADYGRRIQDSLDQLKHAVEAIRSLASALGEADVRPPAVKVPESAEVSSHVIKNDRRKDTVRAIMPGAAKLKSHSEMTMQQPQQPNEHDDSSKERSLDAVSVRSRLLNMAHQGWGEWPSQHLDTSLKDPNQGLRVVYNPYPNQKLEVEYGSTTDISLAVICDLNLTIYSIAFVHGLGGHRLDTWSKGSCCWIQDLLPRDLPEARVMTVLRRSLVLHTFNLRY
jgi:hypothetical protein